VVSSALVLWDGTRESSVVIPVVAGLQFSILSWLSDPTAQHACYQIGHNNNNNNSNKFAFQISHAVFYHCSGEHLACCEVLVMVEMEEEVWDADA